MTLVVFRGILELAQLNSVFPLLQLQRTRSNLAKKSSNCYILAGRECGARARWLSTP
ncbi:predicted protein [Sclerotinia sclerotiorum 1980 UF-70]|uniref:Uncharacterized protein n=1 Tax=Sclerotinia sclerotiorum (strain ATCC 18683 / 1980 / Ss-1) TaxID=665079 RepID=A7E8Z6_SCLS1|nr:predicted protein [Sclerotinia sclerotiorum 1980 UF-70]EDN96848.1 predicted protein [Sclerotinia sclerotiorum 1980 UF-70]